jgi:hypothetical protein
MNTIERLSDQWVSRIFDRMLGRYGNQFAAKFSRIETHNNVETDVGMLGAKEAWAEELSGFADNPDAIAYALKNLPSDFPPNAIQFAELCRTGAKYVKSNAPVPALTYTYDNAKGKKFADELADVVKSANRGSDQRFWATHPKGHLAFEYIRGAASNNPTVFQPCIDHLIAEGKVSEDGKKLLQAYAGNGEWKKA